MHPSILETSTINPRHTTIRVHKQNNPAQSLERCKFLKAVLRKWQSRPRVIYTDHLTPLEAAPRHFNSSTSLSAASAALWWALLRPSAHTGCRWTTTGKQVVVGGTRWGSPTSPVTGILLPAWDAARPGSEHVLRRGAGRPLGRRRSRICPFYGVLGHPGWSEHLLRLGVLVL